MIEESLMEEYLAGAFVVLSLFSFFMVPFSSGRMLSNLTNGHDRYFGALCVLIYIGIFLVILSLNFTFVNLLGAIGAFSLVSVGHFIFESKIDNIVASNFRSYLRLRVHTNIVALCVSFPVVFYKPIFSLFLFETVRIIFILVTNINKKIFKDSFTAGSLIIKYRRIFIQRHMIKICEILFTTVLLIQVFTYLIDNSLSANYIKIYQTLLGFVIGVAGTVCVPYLLSRSEPKGKVEKYFTLVTMFMAIVLPLTISLITVPGEIVLVSTLPILLSITMLGALSMRRNIGKTSYAWYFSVAVIGMCIFHNFLTGNELLNWKMFFIFSIFLTIGYGYILKSEDT